MIAIIVIAVLAGILALVLLAFCIPVDLTFSLEKYDRFQTRVRIFWLFGLVHKEFHRVKKPPEKPKRKRRTDIGSLWEILRTRGFLKRIAILFKDSVKRLRIKNVSAYWRIGLDDAADTGMLFSVLSPAVAMIDYYSDCSVRLEPSFVDEDFLEGHLDGTVRLQPIRLVPPFSRFIFSKPALKVIKNLMLSRWRKRK